MRHTHAEDVYSLFKRWIKEFIIDGNSILTEDKDILTKESLNKCYEYYVKGFEEGNESFDKKLTKQFAKADDNTKLVFAHAEWLWGFGASDITIEKKKHYVKRIMGLPVEKIKGDVFPRGFGYGGIYHNTNKYYEIEFILLIIRFLKDKVENGVNDEEQLAGWVEKICLFQKYGQNDKRFDIPLKLSGEMSTKSLVMTNILTYVSFPDKYENISSNSHKSLIFSSFSGLITKEQIENDDKNLDEKIKLIRDNLTEYAKDPYFQFYDPIYRKVWNYSLSEEGFSEVQGLQYKKSIILYGPPGTSKTYSAKHLADSLIIVEYLKDRENVANYFNKKGVDDLLESRIHHLQLHANYNYEDFIAGIQLVNNETKPVKGELFKICEAARESDLPYVLILDEINRVDLSRLFGELFSALEDRGKTVKLSIGGFELKIPDNLYIIGTMNEIDFSLERIDFALRRRFLWFFYGFNETTLRVIIWNKNSLYNSRLTEEEIDRFVSNSKELNNVISELPELGKQYQVGHTFFSEVVDIYKSYKELHGYTNRIGNKLFRKDGAVKILWDISIEPIISAFLGNLDKDSKADKINEFRNIMIK